MTSMQIYEDVPRKFLPVLPRFEPVVVDATAMMIYKECPRQYLYRIVLGYAGKDNKPYFAWGSAYHKFREHLMLLFKEFTKDGYDPTAIMQAYQPAIDIAVAYWRKHGKDEKPDSKFSHCTEGMLKLACEKAFTQVISDMKMNRVQVLATEQPFTIPLYEDEDDILFGGRLDEVVKMSGQVYVRDFKTTAGKTEWAYRNSLDPNYQFTGYTHAAIQLTKLPITGCVVEVLNVSSKKGPEIFELKAERSPYQMRTWLEEQKYWYQQIKFSRENDIYPQNERSCWNCEFRRLCQKPSPNGILTGLRMDFKLIPWNFYEIRD